MACDCASDYEVSIGREEDYARAKKVLDAGKHPTFVGRDTIGRNARNGGLLMFAYAGEDVGVAVLNARMNSLIVMNVRPSHRGHGLGSAILTYCCPTWVRALESAAPWFRARGYVDIGEPKQGRSLRTQIMVRGSLLTLAGRVSRLLEARTGCASTPRSDPDREPAASPADPRETQSPRAPRQPRSVRVAPPDPPIQPPPGAVH